MVTDYALEHATRRCAQDKILEDLHQDILTRLNALTDFMGAVNSYTLDQEAQILLIQALEKSLNIYLLNRAE